MRDPGRIKPFLAMIEAVWMTSPDERFGQLVMNLTRDSEGRFQDPWNWENSTWREAIERRMRSVTDA